MAPGTPPPGHRLGIRPRQTLQATQRGRRVRRTHLPRHPLPDPPQGRRKTNNQEGRRGIMIFLGAGASAPFGINTSKELTALMREKLEDTNSDLLSAIDVFYKKSVDMEPNFEIMLTLLTAYTNPAQVNSIHHRIFARQHPKFKGNYSKIISDIQDEVCNTCTAPFIQGTANFIEPEKLEEIFSLTYDALFGVPLQVFTTRDILIFSTNYDPSIEIWSQKRNIECLDGTDNIIQNLEIKQVRRIEEHIEDLRNFQQTRGRPNRKLGLVRLHGSVWSYERTGGGSFYKFTRPRDKLLFPDLYEKIKSRKPLLIFPGQEDDLRIGRWDLYYQFLKEKLAGACLFIGYSFGHQVINEQIRSNLKTGRLLKIGIFAPDPRKLIKNLFRGDEIPKNKIVEIPGKFGTVDGLGQLTARWFEEYFHKNWSSGRQAADQSRRWQEENKKLYK